MELSAVSDEVLLSRLQLRDVEAFEQLFKRYWKLLWEFAAKKTGNPAEAEDLVQELFIDIWNKKEKLTLTASFKTYLIACVYLKIFKHFRQKGFRQKHYDTFARTLSQVNSLTENLDIALKDLENEYGKLTDVISQTVTLMPPQMQTVFSLKHIEGFTTSEIADRLNISTETVKTHLKIAMSRLRKAGEQYPSGVLLLPLFIELMQSSY